MTVMGPTQHTSTKSNDVKQIIQLAQFGGKLIIF